MEKVSIVIPVYKVEPYIRQCLDSIVEQTYQNIEIICVDDGSPDRCGEICEEYAKKDTRVRVIHRENGGVSVARNDGVNSCTGDFIYIMDSDDYLEKDAIEVMYNNAINTGADVVITDHYMFQENNKQYAHHIFSQEFVTEDRNVIMEIQKMALCNGYSPYPSNDEGMGIATPWSKLLKRELVFENHLEFDPYVQGVYDDGLFALHVFEYAKKVSYVRAYSYHYRILQNSLIHRYNKNRLEIHKKIFQRIQEFGNKYHKDDEFEKAYCARVILLLVSMYSSYIFNKKYEGTLWKNYREFMTIMNSDPYCSSIRKVDKLRLKRGHRYVVTLSRYHLNWLIWVTLQIRKVLKE